MNINMEHMLKVTLPWKPHAKQRPRGKAGQRSYTPQVTKDAEKAIVKAFHEAVGDDFHLIEDPIAVVLTLENDKIEMMIEKQDEYQNRKLRGDVDNYAKTILDALNGVAWIDDKQIRVLVVAKL